jgi:hypothetical protein
MDKILTGDEILMHKTADGTVRCYAANDYKAGIITANGEPIMTGPWEWILGEYTRLAGHTR